jgi:hypothetical protein
VVLQIGGLGLRLTFFTLTNNFFMKCHKGPFHFDGFFGSVISFVECNFSHDSGKRNIKIEVRFNGNKGGQMALNLQANIQFFTEKGRRFMNKVQGYFLYIRESYQQLTFKRV